MVSVVFASIWLNVWYNDLRPARATLHFRHFSAISVKIFAKIPPNHLMGFRIMWKYLSIEINEQKEQLNNWKKSLMQRVKWVIGSFTYSSKKNRRKRWMSRKKRFNGVFTHRCYLGVIWVSVKFLQVTFEYQLQS